MRMQAIMCYSGSIPRPAMEELRDYGPVMIPFCAPVFSSAK